MISVFVTEVNSCIVLNRKSKWQLIRCSPGLKWMASSSRKPKLLFLDAEPIKVVKETKFLGITFNNKFTYKLLSLTSRNWKVIVLLMNILKVLAKTKWGAESSVLLNLFRVLIRSRLDYGSLVYGSARKSYICMLDIVHHQCICLSLGAFRTSPIQSLYVEANEPSLKLALQYSTKLLTNINNPA